MTDITNNRIDLSDFEPAAPGVDCTCADGGAETDDLGLPMPPGQCGRCCGAREAT